MKKTMTPMEDTLLVARIAGLPASVLELFASDLCSREVENIQSLLAELGSARSALAERLYKVIPGAPARLRRSILAARRDCFNGRPIAPYRKEPIWLELCAQSGRLAETVAELEDRLMVARARLETIHAGERDRERRHLLECLGNGSLLRGIAMASPDSIENLHRLREVSLERYGRKENRLEATLLRYVTRAAFKLSPYSTLTRIGLGLVSSEPSFTPLRLIGASWEERSLLRLKRYLLDQLWELLQRHASFREHLEVELNDTIEEIGPQRFRFLRPGFWDFDAERDRFIYHAASLIKVTLHGPVVAWLLRELPVRRITYGELCRSCAAQAGDSAGSTRRTLDTIEQLTRIGFLCLQPPWPAHSDQLEADILSHLLARSVDPELHPLIDVLNRLVRLQSSFAAATAPERSVRQMEMLIDELWEVAAPLGGLAPETQRSRLRTGNLYEDVFLRNASPRREIVRIPHGAVDTIRRSLLLLERFLGLFDHGHDLRVTLAAFAADRWPERRAVGVVELFSAVQPLWQSFLKFCPQGSASKIDVFNPLGLAELAELKTLRQEIWQGMSQCIDPSPGRLRLRRSSFAALIRRIPKNYAPAVGPCLFIQPADREGRLWVVNRVHEGTGRYGSRFTAAMDPDERSAYTAHLMARGWDATGAELLDITCPQGDTLNVHSLQTQRRLEMPGEPVHLPAARRVNLRDLTVRLSGAGTLPELVDEQGRLCRPVHLGGADSRFMPIPLRILLNFFGPGETRLLLPSRPQQRQGDVISVDRLTLDNLVLLRKRWFVAPNPLRGDLVEKGTEAEAFEVIDRWRREHGIPDRVVFIEHVHHESRDDLYKPQYLDFTSPLLVSLFRTALRQNTESLTFEEMLPMPQTMPKDEQNRPWAVELQLDTLALRPAQSIYSEQLTTTLPGCGEIVQSEPMEVR